MNECGSKFWRFSLEYINNVRCKNVKRWRHWSRSLENIVWGYKLNLTGRGLGTLTAMEGGD